MKTTILIVAVMTLFSGCISSKKIDSQMNSWIGSDKKELILQWGPPSKVESDGNSGEILVYAQHGFVPLSTGQTVNYWLYKMMYVNQSGKIYHWIWRKMPNPPEQVDVRLFVTYR